MNAAGPSRFGQAVSDVLASKSFHSNSRYARDSLDTLIPSLRIEQPSRLISNIYFTEALGLLPKITRAAGVRRSSFKKLNVAQARATVVLSKDTPRCFSKYSIESAGSRFRAAGAFASSQPRMSVPGIGLSSSRKQSASRLTSLTRFTAGTEST